ncbi:MAG: ribosome silencing factor [Verrucomicrobiota bacterium]
MSSRLTEKRSSLKGVDLARAAASLADEKQANDITILDLRGLSSLTDFFVICSGSSPPHLRAVRDEVSKGLREDRETAATHREGDVESQWMVLDFIDVMVHIFQEEKRTFYSLEDLWSDAPRINWQTGETIDSEKAETTTDPS